MPTQRPPSESDPNTMMLLGEIRGQLRELIHNGNNNSAKLDALGLRVAALENRNSRQDGAAGVVGTIMKSPAIGWLVGAAISAWAVLTGKVHF
jgi:hypothetical protein